MNVDVTKLFVHSLSFLWNLCGLIKKKLADYNRRVKLCTGGKRVPPCTS